MADKNVIIKQKLENEIVDFYPKTKSNIVVNESNNVTGSTVTDVFNNALPIKAGEHISITPDASGIKIDFTGSLAPNVTVEGVDGNPVLVSGVTGDTSAVYTVSHKEYDNIPDNGYTTGNASENTTTVINPGQTKDIKIPQISVDKYGHVTTAANDSVKITIPSTDGLVAGTGLTDDRIILGNADANNSSKVKTSPYGIITSSNTTYIGDEAIPTSQWIENRINKKITEGAQYLGLVKAADSNGVLVDINDTPITPNSPGDWVRVVNEFRVPYVDNGNIQSDPELAHVGDILIYHIHYDGVYVWDVIHTEVDTDTWRPIQVGATTLNDSSTTLIISGADGITTALSGGTLTLTGTTYSVSQNANKNKFTFTSSGGASTEIEINNVASAESAKKVENSLTIQLNGGTTEDKSKFIYNGSAAKSINITAKTVGAAAYSHDHGNITSDGKITASGITIQNGDRILFTDTNDSDKIKRSSITFDGTTDTKALTQAGTWQTFLKVNQNITINSGTKKDGSAITGTSHGTKPTLGDSGITAGTYSAIQVNTKGIAIAGSQVIKYYVSSTTNATIQGDTTLAEGGFAFVEIA